MLTGVEDDQLPPQPAWEHPVQPLEASATPSTWTPIDLSDALAGVDVDPPTLLRRSDELRLLYPGRTHWLAGDSESCKSWIAQHATAVELGAGNDVLYIDYEDDDRGVVARLLALGTDPAAIRDHLVYVRPDEALTDRHANPTPAAADLDATLDGRDYTLAVIDGCTEALTVEGLELLDNADIARWMRLLPKRLAATGAVVLVIDHLPKNADTSSRFAIGAQHKLAGVTGAAYKVTVRRPLSRATGTDPVEGEVTLTIVKDRPGYIRGRTLEGNAGMANLTAYPDGGVTVRIDPPGAGGPDHLLVRAVLDYLVAYDGSSGRKVTEGVDGKAERIRDALRWAVAEGWLRVEQKGQSHLHWLTDEGREQLS